MKGNRFIGIMLAIALLLTAAGCAGDKDAVYVQSVAELTGMGSVIAGDRFAGVVVAENVTEIRKDGDKTVDSLLVSVGDSVTKGQKLFSYDTDDLQYRLDKQKLELEQLSASIANYKAQIAELEQEKQGVSGSSLLQYTVQIQSLQLELKEAEISQKSKQDEITQSEAYIQDAFVISPVDGQIQSIRNSDAGGGENEPFIVIQQTGSLRIMGTLGELQRGAIQEGARIKIEARSEDPQVWYGTVSKVNYETPMAENNDDMNMGIVGDPTTTASKYPFYVTPENADGLILGQHVYLSVSLSSEDTAAPKLNACYLIFEEDGGTYVWADKGGKLEKRAVTIGEYDESTDSYEIAEGLSLDDYIAFPGTDLCVAGAKTTKVASVEEDPISDNIGEGMAE